VLGHSDKPLEEREFPDESDLVDQQEESPIGFVYCPACGEPTIEEAPRCPHCGEWFVHPGQGWRRGGKWYVRGGLYLVRLILVNWLFWLLLAAAAAVIAAAEILR
jgi:hypothetical protein